MISGLTKEQRRQLVLDKAQSGDSISLHDLELAKPFYERIITPAAIKISYVVASIAPDNVLNSMARLLAQANLSISSSVVVSTQIILAIVLPSLLAAGEILNHFHGAMGWLVLILSCVVGYSLPYLLISGIATERREQIRRSLPDILDLLTVSVEAGLGFNSAMGKVVDKMSGPLVDEIAIVLGEIRVGSGRAEAMKKMAYKLDIPDLSQFITSFVQADRLGVSITNILRIQAQQMRIRQRQTAQEMAQKAPIKMSFILVFFILPTLLIVLLGPAILTVIEQLSIE